VYLTVYSLGNMGVNHGRQGVSSPRIWSWRR